jgi:hypothetical protein
LLRVQRSVPYGSYRRRAPDALAPIQGLTEAIAPLFYGLMTDLSLAERDATGNDRRAPGTTNGPWVGPSVDGNPFTSRDAWVGRESWFLATAVDR